MYHHFTKTRSPQRLRVQEVKGLFQRGKAAALMIEHLDLQVAVSFSIDGTNHMG